MAFKISTASSLTAKRVLSQAAGSVEGGSEGPQSVAPSPPSGSKGFEDDGSGEGGSERGSKGGSKRESKGECKRGSKGGSKGSEDSGEKGGRRSECGG